MTFKELLIKYNPITSKNQLNELLALTERNFGVFSLDMELDIKSLIKDLSVEEYFNRIIHEEHPKLEYDNDPKGTTKKESPQKAKPKKSPKNKNAKKETPPANELPTKKVGKTVMPWDYEDQNLTVIGIDFNYPTNVTACVAYRKFGNLKREKIDIETLTVSNFAKEKYVYLQKARALMLAYTLLTLKNKDIRFDYIHYALRGKNTHSFDELWAVAIGVYEQLQQPDDVVTKYGQYQIKASTSGIFFGRIFKIVLPDSGFFKWLLPANPNIPWAVAVYLTNPTRLREKRRIEYQKHVIAEKKTQRETKKAKKGKNEDNNTFSYVHSNWSKSWGSYNLVDD